MFPFQEGKSKKRKREDGEKNPAKQRDQQLQQQVEEYNVSASTCTSKEDKHYKHFQNQSQVQSHA